MSVFTFWQGSKITFGRLVSDHVMAVILKQDDSLIVTRDGSSCGKARTWKEEVFWDQPTHSCEWTPLPGASSGHRGAVWLASSAAYHMQLFRGYSSQKQQKIEPKGWEH